LAVHLRDVTVETEILVSLAVQEVLD